MDEIIDNLYISNWEKSNDINELKKNNIKAIITVETECKPSNIIQYYKDNNIDYYYLYLSDLPESNISVYFDKTYNFIKKHIFKKIIKILEVFFKAISFHPSSIA